MKSQTTLVAKQYRIQEWANMIRECNTRPENMTVSDWCEQHAITKCDYYYRMRAVRKACLEAMPIQSEKNVIVPVPSDLMTQNEESLSLSNSAESSVIELITNGITLHVTEQTSSALLAKVLGVIAHVE